MESGKNLKSQKLVHGGSGQQSLAAVIIVILLGLAVGFALGGFIVVGLADHYGASDAVMISLLAATTAGVPTAMAIWFVGKCDRRAAPIVQLLFTFIAAMVGYLAFAPIGCNDSDPPECTSFLGLESAIDDPIAGTVAAVAAGALTWVAFRLLARSSNR